MSLNKNSLKAAVKKYAPLHAEGKSEQEVKDAIAADEKGFDADGVEEIFAAIVNPEDQDQSGDSDENSDSKKSSKSSTYKAAIEFRDVNNFDKKYEKGKKVDVSEFGQERIDFLVKNKYIVEQ